MFAFLLAATVVSTPSTVGLGFAPTYLRPVLDSMGGGARIYYVGICPGDDKLRMPSVIAQPAPKGATGITAIQQIFKNDPRVTVTQDASGIPRITVGSVSTSALQTTLPLLALTSEEQYTAKSAIDSIRSALNHYALEHGLHFQAALFVIDHLVGVPVQGAPHLPPEMRNVAADAALDSVAQTFNRIVFYGECRQPGGKDLFRID